MVLISNTVLLKFILSIYIKLQTCWMSLVIGTANCWPENQVKISSRMESKLWRNAGASAFQLQRNC